MILLPASIMLFLIGKMMFQAPEKNINKWIGYRTKLSMSNEKNWTLAQQTSAAYMYKIFAFILVGSPPFLILDILSLFSILEDNIFLLSLAIQTITIIIGFILVFYLTEKKLKENINL